MTHVKLIRRGEGCQVPDDADYLLVVAREVDANGEWVPTDVRALPTLPQLKEALREIIATGDGIVVHGTSRFERLANELGLRPLTSEWGQL